ncbi:DUF559 domain-containing protein [Streptacidiphilus sp. P02-A3a]|uniref:DUF559 domain-containing protein n=1 Tax=Streptacidiphilus sp. P02-A3a TaxID=2704468 RepID=UPI0015FD9AF9|nr:DUF559 domain-containing protein [Streptacidiphilus sp. P02-A3a]QMU67109.1 DUF559 domain-containing protein [Streptacidiphilus sp. P02-A3a]
MTSIYLAGKIAKNDWRHSLVPLRGAWGSSGGEPEPDWPTISRGILGKFDYIGPFFMSDDHGCGHGSTSHGCGFSGGICGGANPAPHREKIRDLCLAAIDRADIFFAWLDDSTAYGTLVEIGYAYGRGKEIIIASPVEPRLSNDPGELRRANQDWILGDMWFAFSCAKTIIARTPIEALNRLAIATPELESPIEKAFWDAYQKITPAELADLRAQYSVLGGKYRLDFAIPEKKIAIELDGYAWHSSPQSFTRDRARQRDLEFHGWRLIRFSGAEIVNDSSGCVRQAARMVNAWARKV